MESMIQTEKLSHIYSAGTPFEHGALIDVDFTAYRGEYLGIIGHTGSGKSTLIQHLNGLLKPTSGRVLVEGQDIWASKEATRAARFRVGLVFQYPEYQLFEETVYKDIAFGPKNMGLDETEIDHRVREAAAFVGLSDAMLDQSPFELSGGQKRRVAIAGVIAMEPAALILDEPTAGLDPVGVEQILGNIRDYHKAKNATILIVSHSMEEMARTVDRLVVINDGRIPFQGTPREVFAHGEELEAMGLGVPQVTRVFQRLRAMGADVDPTVYTIPQAKEALLAALGRGPRKASPRLCGERKKESADMEFSAPWTENGIEQTSSDEKGAV
ncbi:energy-coupling factor transporter ATPase [Candidatus Pseudoscillospira sp. SGI.172]|uniref:energy-coupling factor transporter ATPase n=1 Tax=Candidatus Pseudoscillospira sp. SGI.172 TaxID=3420582 RepID=UPI0009BAF488|nr:energy-coupling factor transporter ATPase [Pseudoflavonifractor sp.]MDY3020505.1 energy-coupling factor transporter ATPase [Oscillospiraceae bacterium]